MGKQVSIKEIARMAGVSAGTVDRVIHNRGKVSKKAQDAVNAVLEKVDYRSKIHASAISLKKGFKLILTIPVANKGEYWHSMECGFNHALKEYSDIRISVEHCFYDQFDVFSCKEAFSHIIEQKPDGVIIGPTFKEETKELCDSLDTENIPYVFVDASIDDTHPIATFSIDQEACGKLIGKLLFNIIAPEDKIAIFSIKRTGNAHSENSQKREKGLLEFANEIGRSNSVLKISVPISGSGGKSEEVTRFFRENSDIRGVAVMNSRGQLIAQTLKDSGIEGIKLICFDLTDNNKSSVENGEIFALLCQRPQLQGFGAIESMIRYLLYNLPEAEPNHILPIDIVVKENLPFYQEVSAK